MYLSNDKDFEMNWTVWNLDGMETCIIMGVFMLSRPNIADYLCRMNGE